MSMVSVTGQVSDSSVIFFNKVPFIEIEYPVPHIVKDYEKKNVRNTVNDVITVGLNFYENISEIRLKSNESEKMNSEELSELTQILRGGVIYIGSGS